MKRKLLSGNVIRAIAIVLTLLTAPFMGRTAPDPPTTLGDTVYFQGNQGNGVTWFVPQIFLIPAKVNVTNLNSGIFPASGTSGIEVQGTDSSRVISVRFDGSGEIITTGANAYGIHVRNSGGDAGTYLQVTNFISYVTNVINVTNVVVTPVTNLYGANGPNAFTTNVSLLPAGGVSVVNNGSITTYGDNSHGIFAEVPFGTIYWEFFGSDDVIALPYGPGGPVSVVNTGDITTWGNGSQGIVAMSRGGVNSRASDAAVLNTGDILTVGQYSHGIFALSQGGNGSGGSSGLFGGSSGGPGGDAQGVSVTGSGNIVTFGDDAAGILAVSQAGNGGGGGSAYVGGGGGGGGSAGKGGNVTVQGSWNVTTHGTNSVGISAHSAGGNGGGGGGGGFFGGGGGGGGSTGDGGRVQVNSGGVIETIGSESHGILAASVGGFAGNGGTTAIGVFYAAGGNGGSAGSGGTVVVTNLGSIITHGRESHAIFAESIGGGGGSAGSGHGIYAVGGDGDAGGAGGTVVVQNSATLITEGQSARGIFAQSVGGGGGDGGDSGGIGAVGGGGSSTSYGGKVSIFNSGNISSSAHSIFAQSIGGGGGNGGSTAGWFAVGGSGGGGGNGLEVRVNNSGALQTYNMNSSAILAQSVGGGGGNGGNSVAAGAYVSMAVGGAGGKGGGADKVFITSGTNTITTGGNQSHGIFAQSVGGGGGSGGFAASVSAGQGASASFAIGGSGGDGGGGSNVFVNSQSRITTFGTNSHGIFAQSVGGGGGSGGFAISVAASDGPALSLAMGGKGGGGGSSESVSVVNSGNIYTFSEHAYGILAQSVGGGGGDGGFSIAGSFSAGPAAAPLSFGGSGDVGGSSRTVNLVNSGNIGTKGDNSHGIFAQSVGGGGGSGGFSVAGAISTGGAALAASFGGSGAGGGTSDVVRVYSSGNILTEGNRSYGILGQSIGGGGGDGGFAVAAAINSGGPSLSLALGGSAGGGVSSASVWVTNVGNITTRGEDSHGVFAQSLGGGGGSGGFSIAGSLSSGASAGLSIGGGGGDGGFAGTVTLINDGDVFTRGTHAYGLLAQSIGGGGGDGGFSIAGSLGKGPGVAFAMGGAGGAGSYGNTVTLRNTGDIFTSGELAYGILAQSVGGGGGSGGFAVAGQLSTESSGAAVTIGGDGGDGSNGGIVLVNNSGSVTTTNKGAHAIVAQSVGGGGGVGGFAGSLRGGFGDGTSLSVAVGGTGGDGGSSSTVNLTNAGGITTVSEAANGIFAQSVGGGGGDGGFALSAAFGLGQKSVNVALAIGGGGGDGGAAGNVNVANQNVIMTFGSNSHGIFAQSIGGGGGNGGFSAAGTLSTSTNSKQLSVSIGGNGGTGNHAGTVAVNNATNIFTMGNESIGVFAQSVGGGGGNGGMSFAGTFSVGGSKSASFALGGSGAGAGDGNTVNVNSRGAIETWGDGSQGIFAQSVGGGGGRGGLAIAANLGVSIPSNTSYHVGISIGGQGGAGGVGGNVFVSSASNIVTHGDDAQGIVAQSIGGGGGVGGASLAGSVDFGADQGKAMTANIAVGGGGGDGNNGGLVAVNHTGLIDTSGDNAHAIHAQSVGGGGGEGGGARSFAFFIKTPGGGGQTNSAKNKSLNVSIGGDGGGSSSGGDIIVTNLGNIITRGGDSHGIFAQSIGGGGGSGGNAHEGLDFTGSELLKKFISAKSDDYTVVVGGNSGSSGNGDSVTIHQVGDITTLGAGSYGIFAQSVGGGGGAGGNGEIGATGQVGIGGRAGAAGHGSNVTVHLAGNITTWGLGAHAIVAQSVGGGGGFSGNVERGLESIGLNVGLGLAFGGNGGGGGNGGNVTVNSSGTLMTTNTGASGIFAQSVGGGGGVAGDLGNDLPGLSLLNFAGSVGDAGSGGNVTVQHTGNIITLGTNSHGIFAQSAGGANTGGAVNVSLNGSIAASGFGADGIFAQSRGNAGASDINITLTNGTVVGANNGAAVRFGDGANNTLNNYNTLTTRDGLTGTTLGGSTGNDRIINHATVIGSVNLGSGINTFSNLSGAWFNAGPTINLGNDSGSALVNAGLFSLAGAAAPQVTTLSGNFIQATGGIWQVKLGSTAAFDAVRASGAATLNGELFVLRYNDYLPKKADQFNFLRATNGVNGQFSSIADPYKTNYSIMLGFVYQPDSVDLVVLQDTFQQFARNANHRSLSMNLDSFSGWGTTGGDPRGAALIEYLNTVPGRDLPHVFDLINAEEYGALFDVGFGSASLQSGNLEQRLDDFRRGLGGDGGLALFNARGVNTLAMGLPDSLACGGADEAMVAEEEYGPKGWRAFATGSGQLVDVEKTGNAAGYNIQTEGITVGADHAVSSSLVWGVNAGFVATQARLAGDGYSDVNGGKLGLHGTWYGDNTYLNAVVGGGWNYYNIWRDALGGKASGETDGYEATALIGGGHDFTSGHWIFGPIASLRYTYVDVNGFTESGSLAPLRVQDNDSDSLLMRLGGRVACEFPLGKALVRPELRLAWQHEFLDTTHAIDSRFASGAGSVYRVSNPETGRDSLSVGAGVSVQCSSRVAVYAYYGGELLQNNYNAHTVSGGVSIGF